MARQARIEIPGSWYYISNNGPRRKALFRNEADRQHFLGLLADAHARYGAEWHGYCLLRGGYHLLVRTPEANLQRIMRHVNALYTQHYNRGQRISGSLFPRRYRALLIDGEQLALPLSRHLHLLPLLHRESDDVAEFSGSSCRYYLHRSSAPAWLYTSSADALKSAGKRRTYLAYLEEENSETLQSFIENRREGALVGDQRFIQTMQRAAGKQPPRSNNGRPKAHKIVEVTASHFETPTEKVMTSTRGRGVDTPARSVAMYLCQEIGGMTLREIAEHFQLSGYASAGSTIRNVRLRIADDPALDRDVQRLRKSLASG